MWEVFITEKEDLMKKGKSGYCIFEKETENMWNIKESLSLICSNCKIIIKENVEISKGLIFCSACFPASKSTPSRCFFFFFL